MDIKIISERFSCRKFLLKPVSKGLVEEAIRIGQCAPSTKNTQPWKVAVFNGETLRALSDELVKAVEREQKLNPDYASTLSPMPSVFKERARKCGYDLFALKGIARDDYKARKAHDIENFKFFAAPQALILYLDKAKSSDTVKGQYLDAGMFLINLWHGLRLQGIEACAQYSIACYPDIVRKHLSIPQETEIVCALSFGYEDKEDIVNSYRTVRADFSEFVEFSWQDEI